MENTNDKKGLKKIVKAIGSFFSSVGRKIADIFGKVNKALLPLKENKIIAEIMPIAFLGLLFLFFVITTRGKILNPATLKIIIDQALICATVATGASFIFSTGNINIAMGSSTALTCTIAAKVYMATSSVPLMFIAAIAFGTILLICCALLSTVLNVKVMFVTIVMMVMLSAIHETILGAGGITLPFAMTKALKTAGVNYILFGAYVLACIVIFHFTAVGRKLKMTGSNATCAEQTGITSKKSLLTAFVIAGVGVGCGALLTLIRTSSVGETTCNDLNMNCMLAIVLGGMPVFGGSKSKAYSALIGSVTVTLLGTGLLMIGVDSTILQAVRGVIFLVLVILGTKRPKLLPTREG